MITYPNVTTVQIIFNMFRLKPAESFFAQAAQQDIGIIARVPLASGLLSGKISKESHFGKDDHRNFNRNGEAFDKGETFSGVDFDKGLRAVDELKEIFKDRQASLAQLALRWVLMYAEVSTVIAGASRPEQVAENVVAGEGTAFTDAEMEKIGAVYNQYFKEMIHPQW